MAPFIVVIDYGRSYIRVGSTSARPHRVIANHGKSVKTTSFGHIPLQFPEYLETVEAQLRDALRDNVGLEADPSSRSELRLCWLTGSLALPPQLLRAIATVLFSDAFKFDVITFLPSPSAVLSANVAHTGVIVDIGGRGATVSAMVEGGLVRDSLKDVRAGGDLVTFALKRLMIEWYGQCSEVYEKRLRISDLAQGVEYKIDLKRDWRLATSEDLQGLSEKEWDNIKVRCCYATDRTPNHEGEYTEKAVRKDALIDIKEGTLLLAVPKKIRYLCAEFLMMDGFEPNHLAHRPYLLESQWKGPWSSELALNDEISFLTHCQTIGSTDDEKVHTGERLFRHIIQQWQAPLDPHRHQSLIRAIIGSFESLTEPEREMAVQNLIITGAGAELFGLKERIANEIKDAYLLQPTQQGESVSFQDPFPDPSPFLKDKIDTIRFRKCSFSDHVLTWCGASLNARISVTPKFESTIGGLIKMTRPATEEREHSIEDLDALLADANRLPSQLMFRTIFDPQADFWDFFCPEFSIPHLEKNRPLLHKIYEPDWAMTDRTSLGIMSCRDDWPEV